MKHLVLVVGMYYPNPSPTGQLAGRYISLLKERYRVDVVFIQQGESKTEGIWINKERLFSLSNWRLRVEDYFKKIKVGSYSKIIRKVAYYAVEATKAFGAIQSFLVFPNNLKWYEKKAYRKLCEIHSSDPIDVVFTVSFPFSAHLAGERFKRKYNNVYWATYTVDLFYKRHKNWKNLFISNSIQAFKTERAVFRGADMNFLSQEIFDNCEALYEGYEKKVCQLPYLLWHNEVENDDNMFDNIKINLVYAGRFFKDIRNPEYLLKTILATKDDRIILHLFSSSNCETLIDKYVEESNGKIIKHGMVSSEEIKSVLASADFLVNVGNSIPEVKPSKTFEYLATGKPIIHFYQNGYKDILLKAYPLSIQVSFDSLPENSSREIEEFCLENLGKIADFNKIQEIYEYNSKEHIKGLLEQALK